MIWVGLRESTPILMLLAFVGGALLGHARSSTTERYAHLSADPLRKASEAIASRIAGAMAGNGAQ